MKKRNFLSLLASAPLLGLFKEKPHTLTAEYLKPGYGDRSLDNVMTAEKLEEISRWMQKKGIKPIKLPDRKEYYLWSVEPNRYHRHFVESV